MRLVQFLILLVPIVVFADQVKFQSYTTVQKKIFWVKLYPNGGNTLYCNQHFVDRSPLNIEHVYPAAWMVDHFGCGSRKKCRRDPKNRVRFGRMEADLHNLFPVMAGFKSARSNKTFGIIPGEKHALGFCDFELDEHLDLVEPRPGARGIIARTILYMNSEYQLPVKPWLFDTIKQWHKDYPLSTWEIWRNEMIFKLQGNRNQFIGK